MGNIPAAVKKLDNARQDAIGEWREALDYEADLTQQLIEALRTHSIQPKPGLATFFRSAFLHELVEHLQYVSDLRQIDSFGELRKVLKAENRAIGQMREILGQQLNDSSPGIADVMQNWMDQLDREEKVNVEIDRTLRDAVIEAVAPASP